MDDAKTDGMTTDEKAERESPVQRFAREMAERDAETKEEILRAFVAKRGYQPDECEVVQNGMVWFVRRRSDLVELEKREKAVEEDRKELGELIKFFNTSVGGRFANLGDENGWSPARTAIHFLSEYSFRLLPKSREERISSVEAELRELNFNSAADLVGGYGIVERAAGKLQQEKLL
jgi:hypothetical protein